MDSSHFRRDSVALINTDESGLRAYKTKKEQNKKVEQIVHDINTFKSELEEIKALLRQIINKE